MSSGPGKGIQRNSAGNLVGANFSGVIFAMSLAAGSGAAATVDLKEGGSGGTVIWTLAAVQAGGDSIDFPNGLAVAQPYIDIAGAGAVVSVELV